MKFGVNIPQSQMDAVETRAHRLAVEIDKATISSPDRRVRETGGQVVDRILEWVEEIKDLREIGDEDVMDRIQSFQARLALAEKAVAAWPKPGQRARAETRRRKKKEPRAA